MRPVVRSTDTDTALEARIRLLASAEGLLLDLLPPRSRTLWEQQEPTPSRNEVLARYRHLREISKQHHFAIMKLISRDAMMRHARGLGLTIGKTLVLDSMEELSLAYDLAIYTAPADRTRAVDRYTRSAPFEPGSDKALMLDAMCNARDARQFSPLPH